MKLSITYILYNTLSNWPRLLMTVTQILDMHKVMIIIIDELRNTYNQVCLNGIIINQNTLYKIY